MIMHARMEAACVQQFLLAIAGDLHVQRDNQGLMDFPWNFIPRIQAI